MFATWEISFKAIQEKSPKAAELLLICGFFDHEDIREELLRRGLRLDKQGMNTLMLNVLGIILKPLLMVHYRS